METWDAMEVSWTLLLTMYMTTHSPLRLDTHTLDKTEPARNNSLVSRLKDTLTSQPTIQMPSLLQSANNQSLLLLKQTEWSSNCTMVESSARPAAELTLTTECWL